MKKIIILLCSVVLLLFSVPFSGCGRVNPYEIEWHLESYDVIGENYYRFVGFDYYNHFGSVLSDCAKISFKNDGSFYFTDKDGAEYDGTYKSKKELYDTTVTLMFSDGREAVGSYDKFEYNGAKYEAYFEIFGVNYYFDDRERNFNCDDLDRRLKNLADAIYTFATDGRMEAEHYPYYENLKRAEIGKVGDKFVVITPYSSYLLDSYNFWCYGVNGERIEKSELKEGGCIIRTGYNNLAIYYL